MLNQEYYKSQYLDLSFLIFLYNFFYIRFSDNFLKANPDKCHLLINTDENVALKRKHCRSCAVYEHSTT